MKVEHSHCQFCSGLWNQCLVTTTTCECSQSRAGRSHTEADRWSVLRNQIGSDGTSSLFGRAGRSDLHKVFSRVTIADLPAWPFILCCARRRRRGVKCCLSLRDSKTKFRSPTETSDRYGHSIKNFVERERIHWCSGDKSLFRLLLLAKCCINLWFDTVARNAKMQHLMSSLARSISAWLLKTQLTN
jgi:hypothetical protein